MMATQGTNHQIRAFGKNLMGSTMAGAAEMYFSAVARSSLAALPSSWPSLISRQVKVKQKNLDSEKI